MPVCHGVDMWRVRPAAAIGAAAFLLTACGSSSPTLRSDPNATIDTKVASGEPVSILGDWTMNLPSGSLKVPFPLPDVDGLRTTSFVWVSASDPPVASVFLIDVPGTIAQVQAHVDDIQKALVNSLLDSADYTVKYQATVTWAGQTATESVVWNEDEQLFHVLRFGVFDGHVIGVQGIDATQESAVAQAEELANSLRKAPE